MLSSMSISLLSTISRHLSLSTSDTVSRAIAAIQPPRCDGQPCPASDIFAQTFGDHFHLFGLDPVYDADAGALRERYLALQRSLHPDRYACHERDACTRAESASTAVNSAYAVLSDPEARAFYLLARGGWADAEGKSKGKTLSVPPATLMQAMDDREAVEACQPGQMRGLEQGLERRRGQAVQELGARMKEWEVSGKDEDAVRAGAAAYGLRYLTKSLNAIRERILETPLTEFKV